VRSLLEAGVKESNAYCIKVDPNFAGFSKMWPAELKHAAGEEVESPVAAASMSASEKLHEEGEHLMHHWVGFAWLIGIGAGVLLYWNGYAIMNNLMKFPPMQWTRTWLYRRPMDA